jgi:hypothetical protein
VRAWGRAGLGLLIALLSAALACAHRPARPAYAPASVAAVVGSPREFLGKPVILAGRVADLRPGDALVAGTLADGAAALGFAGEAVDWRPSPGERVELWGAVRSGPGGPYLEFHNGRPEGDRSRQPRPTPPLERGEAVELVGVLHQVGNEPFVRWAVRTEDGVAAALAGVDPAAAGATAGDLVRVRGTVAAIGGPGPILEVTGVTRLGARP